MCPPLQDMEVRSAVYWFSRSLLATWAGKTRQETHTPRGRISWLIVQNISWLMYSGATLGCQHEWGGVEAREEHSEPLRSLHTSPVNASPQLRAMPLWDDTTDSIRCLAHSTFWTCQHTWSFSIELLLHGALDSSYYSFRHAVCGRSCFFRCAARPISHAFHPTLLQLRWPPFCLPLSCNWTLNR